MIVIAGLGNPEEKYQSTRHNVGMRVVNRIAQIITAPVWHQLQHASIAKLFYQDQPLILLKPFTFMNNAGQAVVEVINYYDLKPTNLWLIHDEAALDIGKYRLRLAGSAGGHNGVKSVIEHLGSGSFLRIKVGIGSPDREASGRYLNRDLTDYVLGNFTEPEEQKIGKVIDSVAQFVVASVGQGEIKDNTQKTYNAN